MNTLLKILSCFNIAAHSVFTHTPFEETISVCSETICDQSNR